MKYNLITTLFVLMGFSASAQQDFNITGILTGDQEGNKILLSYRDFSEGSVYPIKDSTYVKDGRFSFTGRVEGVSRASLYMEDLSNSESKNYMLERLDMDEQEFLLENEIYLVKGSDINHAIITGGAVQADFLKLKEKLKHVSDRLAPLTREAVVHYLDKNKDAHAKVVAELSKLRSEEQKIKFNFLHTHPDAYVNLYTLSDYDEVDSPAFEKRFHALSTRIKNTPMAKELYDRHAAGKTFEIGKPAVDFVQHDLYGRPITLSAYAGKYVLLDFWASWCAPCREETPFLQQAHDKYRDKGFEILAISLDSRSDSWRNAIYEDKATDWIQLSDLKGTKNEVALLYGVYGVPDNFLINPEGVIVARNLRGRDLEELLSSLIE